MDDAVAGAPGGDGVTRVHEGVGYCHERPDAVPKRKVSYIGAPACFALELACQHLNRAFGGFGCYLVGSAMERADWRDVDVRLIMPDAEFLVLFPDVDLEAYNWEFDPRWLIMTTSISDHLRKVTGLPVDFQFQAAGPANKRHGGKTRSAMGLRFKKPSKALGMSE